MRLVRNRVFCAVVFSILSMGLALAQPVPRTNPANTPENAEKQELGPNTPKTKAEIDGEAPPPAISTVPSAEPVDPKTYVIGPEDVLLVRVWREPDLSGLVQVRPDGKITLQFVGELTAAGETPEGLKNKITEALQELILKPDVFVSLQAVRSKKYYIMGEVGRTGTFPLVVPTTVLEALSNAGSFREFANTKKITILRKGKTLKFNYNDVVKGKNMEQNVLLEPGDLIHVP